MVGFGGKGGTRGNVGRGAIADSLVETQSHINVSVPTDMTPFSAPFHPTPLLRLCLNRTVSLLRLPSLPTRSALFPSSPTSPNHSTTLH